MSKKVWSNCNPAFKLRDRIESFGSLVILRLRFEEEEEEKTS